MKTTKMKTAKMETSYSIFANFQNKTTILPKNFKNLTKVQKTATKEIVLSKHMKRAKVISTIFDREEVSRFDQYLHKYVNKNYNFFKDIINSDYNKYKEVIDAFEKANDDEHDWYCRGGATFLYLLADYFVIAGEFEKAKLLLWGFWEAAYDYYFVYPNAIPTLILIADIYPERFIKTVDMTMTLLCSSDIKPTYRCEYTKINNKAVLKTLKYWENKLNWKFVQGNKFVIPSIDTLRVTFYQSWHKSVVVTPFDKKHLNMDEDEYLDSFYFVSENYEQRFNDILRCEVSEPGMKIFKS